MGVAIWILTNTNLFSRTAKEKRQVQANEE